MPTFQIDYFTFASISRARKDYSCQECQAPIQRGSIYGRITGRFRGRVSWSKCLCEPCGREEIGEERFESWTPKEKADEKVGQMPEAAPAAGIA